MENYIKSIKVNKIFHLQDFEIPISDERFPHLFITGKNGSGKTILLNAIADFLEKVRKDKFLYFLQYEQWVNQSKKNLIGRSGVDKLKVEKTLENNEEHYNKMFGKVDVSFTNIENTIKELQDGDFIIAFYEDYRKVKMDELKNPEKPNLKLNNSITHNSTAEFLKFLVDLKIQAALAQNEKLVEDAEKINSWFREFEDLLRVLFGDDNLKLNFNYKDYSVKLLTEGKEFGFNQLSAGYAAIIDIIVDLILKMQDGASLSSVYTKRAIVLIDEIETHLHLDLQRNIMPILTKVFPNIQFIVTTHSPFVLSSLPNAVAFDLEHREIIDNLNEYSYEALAEGYFGVKTSSSYLEMRLNELSDLLSKSERSHDDIYEIKRLIEDFGKVSEAASPLMIGKFNQLRIDYAEIIKEL